MPQLLNFPHSLISGANWITEAMKTKIEKWRNYFFCQCQWIRFTVAALWCVFFATAGQKVQSQQTQWPSNSLPEAASDASVAAAMSSDTSTNVTSTNEVQQVEQPVSPSAPASSGSSSQSGVMAYPAPSWSGQTISNSTSSAMAYPAPASSGSSSQSGVMAYPAPSWSGQTNSSSGAMAYPASVSPDSLNSKNSGVMAYPAPAWSGQTNSTPAAELSAPAPGTPTATQPPPAPAVEQPASAPATPVPVAEQPAPAPAATTEQAAPAPPSAAPAETPPPATEAAPTPPPAPAVSAEQPAASTTEQTPAPSEGFSMTPPPTLRAPKATKNEVSASGDIMFGSGKVSLPLGYSLNKSTGGGFTPETFDVPRSSVYYGGTLSYSYGQAWYIDLSLAQGHSSGSQAVPTGEFGSLPSSFSIDDTWYQLYIKYTFPQLRGKRFSAYLRAGASYITATLNDEGTGVGGNGRYSQHDTTDDILGNLGAGLAYNLFATHRLRVDLQGEIEGFGGERSQKTLETLSGDQGFPFVADNINNTLYGGIGLATVHLEYRMGRAGLFKIFGDAGIEGRYALVQYPSGGGTPTEYLWGPYIKAGLRYSF
jgi:hypothetical protein